MKPGDFHVGVISFFAILVPRFMRYYERRLKSTSQAYMYMITLHRHGKLKAPAQSVAVESAESVS
jgi:hypothetical protein